MLYCARRSGENQATQHIVKPSPLNRERFRLAPQLPALRTRGFFALVGSICATTTPGVTRLSRVEAYPRERDSVVGRERRGGAEPVIVRG
jgi:hypothetical protein